jgi:hypothetical protein
MSALPHTPNPGFATRFAPRRLVVILALIATLAAAALTVAIVSLASGPGGSGKATPVRVLPSAPDRRYFGGPGEGTRGTRGSSAGASPRATPNDGSQHSGARP